MTTLLLIAAVRTVAARETTQDATLARHPAEPPMLSESGGIASRRASEVARRDDAEFSTETAPTMTHIAAPRPCTDGAPIEPRELPEPRSVEEDYRWLW